MIFCSECFAAGDVLESDGRRYNKGLIAVVAQPLNTHLAALLRAAGPQAEECCASGHLSRTNRFAERSTSDSGGGPRRRRLRSVSEAVMKPFQNDQLIARTVGIGSKPFQTERAFIVDE